MELTWSQHYCLACDRQTSGGAYCSQSCRLADHETSSNWSGSSSSSRNPMSSTTILTPPISSSPRGSGFYLSPAINFDAYKSSSKPASPGHPLSPSKKILSPSSSRSSLASNGSASSGHHHLSEKVHNELLAYTNSFDSTRNWKRRQTW